MSTSTAFIQHVTRAPQYKHWKFLYERREQKLHFNILHRNNLVIVRKINNAPLTHSHHSELHTRQDWRLFCSFCITKRSLKDWNRNVSIPVRKCRSVTLFAGATLVDSKTALIVMTSLALLVVSEPLTGDVVVDANVEVCKSATPEISDEICDEDVTKLLLTSSVIAVSSLMLLAASASAVAMYMNTGRV